ncbi:hypothetical protein [Acidithiobacillus concretivorus]|uniref:Uncharacterized protein n=1 Tax=Acidithiobacillus concretivorus TaxID=3063952 RepID=A0ABS5ZTF3_9PROT|nr:hypothetical protein [Acidithiobacillus concretivorus]MBU2739680.1 hypothetical protein [Acidithiobacillus concretivorus]
MAHDKTLDFRVSACSAAGRISVYPDGMDKPSVAQEVGVVPPQVGAEGVAARPDNGKNYRAVAAVHQQAVAEGAGLLPVAVEGGMDSTDNKTEDSNTT